MLIHLHSQATTTPKVRAEIQASDEPAWILAERYGTTEQTVWKWRKRDSVNDRSHTAHRLQTTLTPAQEAVAVALRKALLVSLDDLLAVVREFLNPDVSRSGLDRCLRRHGVANLRDLKGKAARPKHSGFKAYEPGYIHIDVKFLPQMADQTSRRYLFVAIDRATRWVFIRVYNSKTAANARRFLRDLERACPIRIRTILTDNGKEFTDRLFGLRKRAQSGKHEFDKLCAVLDIDHRLTPPMSPQTNGMVERFNGRIEDVLQSHHFRSGEELEATLHRYVWLYNQQLPQSALGSKTPLQAMKDWHKLKPELFNKQPYYRPGCDTYPSPNGTGEITAYLARPTEIDTRRPPAAVLVVHENRGLNPYIRDVVRRLAKAGFVAMGPDGLSSLGGYPGSDDEGREMQRTLDRGELLNDFFAGFEYLQTLEGTNGKVGATGFCYGGGVVNKLAVAYPEMAAGVPFYGAAPASDQVAQIEAPLMIQLAALDQRINAMWPDFQKALEANDKRYEANIYAGVNHGFHNDTTPRYDEQTAKEAEQNMIAWFRTYLAA